MSEEKQVAKNAEQVQGNAESTPQVLEGEIVDAAPSCERFSLDLPTQGRGIHGTGTGSR